MGTESKASASVGPKPERSERTRSDARADIGGTSLEGGVSVLEGPLSAERIEEVQRSAGNKAATELVNRERASQALRLGSASGPMPMQAVQRDEDESAEAVTSNDASALAAASTEELINLYLTDEPTSTLPGTESSYTLDWVRSGRGSALIRDALIATMTSASGTMTMHYYFYLLIDTAGGPAERATGLKSLIDATFVPREQLGEELSAGATRHLTGQGYLMELPVPGRKTNNTNRPRLRYERSDMVEFEGALVHPAVVSALTSLLAGLRREGERLNDESARQAKVNNGYRPPTQREGNKYLSSLRKTIRKGVDIHGNPYTYPAFPTALEGQATSELGYSGSAEHSAFKRALAASPGWTTAQANTLLRATGAVKAPRGGSAHHSGLVVDIDWPVWNAGRVSRHGMSRDNNEAALASVAGRWLYEHAASFGFASYNTKKEIWHMEWLDWAGTEADPDTESGEQVEAG